MKKSLTFSQQYPYLVYWVEYHGYMRLGSDDESAIDSILVLLDAGGTCYEDEGSDSIDEALAAAEEYLRKVDFPERFDQETIDEIEAIYQENNLT
jgi:hypothetical protein